MAAAQNGHVEVVRALVKAGANTRRASKSGVTPLFIAAHNGHPEVVRALVMEAEVSAAQADKAAAIPVNILPLDHFDGTQVATRLVQVGLLPKCNMWRGI